MDTDLTVAVAQILTGAATLVVAFFLAGQVALQRKVLSRAHEDADRELTLTSLGLFLQYLQSRTTSDSLRQLYAKRHEGLDSLDAPDFDGLSTHLRAGYLLTNTEWRLNRNRNLPGYYIKRFDGLMDSVGGRQYYVQSGRAIINQPNLIEFADEVYAKLEGKPVPETAGKAIGFVS